MLIRKIDQRIQQYLSFLDQKKFQILLKPQVSVAKTQDYNYKIPTSLKKSEITFPYQYGEEKTNYWFFISFKIPNEYKNEEIYLFVPTGADSLVFINDIPIGAINPYHPKIKLHENEIKEKITIAIESYAGHIIPGYHPMHKPRVLLTLGEQLASYPINFPTCDVLKKNKILFDLYYDVLVLYDLASQLDNNSLRKNEILRELYHALIEIHFVSDEKTLEEEANHASTKIKPLLLLHNGLTMPNIFVIGHAHIDHAWLWPLTETVRKAARTFSNMARLGEEYPEFIFIQSQPAQLELVKEKYPAIFEQVINAYKRNQWEPNGGMFVEADTNVPSGESLIRQFLVGKKLTKEFFDYYGDTLWLPDVFGYSGNLPQILRGCGIKYFVTSKINWNDTTRFPYDTFNWSGIDGTVIHSHFLTTSYEGFVSIKAITESWNRVQHKEVQNGLIKPFGEGDGGGGSTRSDLEYTRRINDLEGCPRTNWSKVSTALDNIFDHAHDVPTWHGELYLELHRGTYTTIANTKKYNRKIEQLLRKIEFFSVLCTREIRKMMGFASGSEYQHELLLKLWKLLLTHQFHDIIPGSSINQVNNDALASYQQVVAEIDSLNKNLEESYLAETPQNESKESFLVLNSLSWTRKSLIALPIKGTFSESYFSVQDNQKYPCQVYKNFNNENNILALTDTPPMAFSKVVIQKGSDAKPTPFVWKDEKLQTPFYNIVFTKSMQIQELSLLADPFNYVDKQSIFNTIQLAEDMPVTWDAWDIEWDTFDQKIQNLDSPDSVEVISNGPLFFQIRIKYSFSNSDLVQDMIFYAHDERIDFITKVSWHEDYKVLRTIFPSTVLTDNVKCEIQNGYLNRPTTKNRDHERAMFEICAHKWVQLDDGLRGLALLNDSKYGHQATRNQLSLTLLRSPKHPDEFADMGEHEFTYSIIPFKQMPIHKVIQKGYELNNRPDVFKGSLPDRFINNPFCSVSNPNIIIESVKKAESDSGIIVRLYESTGSFNTCTLKFFNAFKSIFITNLLEENKEKVATNTSAITVDFHAFEIKTLLIE